MTARWPLQPGKVPNGVRWKNLFAAYRIRRLPDNSRFYYKSDALPAELRQQILGIAALSRKPIPLIPSACPGQFNKVSQAELSAQ
jgi:hypothetical protein